MMPGLINWMSCSQPLSPLSCRRRHPTARLGITIASEKATAATNSTMPATINAIPVPEPLFATARMSRTVAGIEITTVTSEQKRKNHQNSLRVARPSKFA